MNNAWYLKEYAALSKQELHEIFRARQAVFVVEQECAYPDIDGLDTEAIHLWSYFQTEEFEEGTINAYARILPPGVHHSQLVIGRVLTAQNARGGGLGLRLMQQAMAVAEDRFPDNAIKIGAQLHLTDFYQSLDFEIISEPYDEDGIAHIDMLRSPR